MVRMVELADNFKAAIITMFSEVKYAHNKWKGRHSRQTKKWKFYIEKNTIVEVLKKAQ